MSLTDSATDIRQGEELNIQAVETYLKDTIPGLTGNLEVKQYPSGFSNLTYLIEIGTKKLVLRRPPFGTKAKTAHDMGREFKILSSIREYFPYCPKPLVYTEDESILGAPFYVMERIEGIILRKNLPKTLSFSADDAKTLCTNLIDVLLELHAIDYKKIGLDNLGKPEGYINRQVAGWSKRYRAARTQDAPDFESIMTWLEKNQPADSKNPSLIHNDYKFDNVVLDPENPLKIIGVLDWEMATIGDPLMDLGATIAYWINRDDSEEMQLIRMLPTNIEGALTRKEIISYYLERSGVSVQDFTFYQCCNVFRVATIAQQIYYRFYHGQTNDTRFGMFIGAVQVMERSINSILEKNG
ncbi:phosphotransferase family protein [bacterium]|nr:phosphotransferase family protein [bacterium]